MRTLPVFSLAVLTAALSLGQLASNTSLVGQVSDSAGASVQGAAVTAVNTGTSETMSTVTNSEGNYEFLFIKTGTYNVSVKQQGFESITISGINVATNQVVRNDFTLKVGQVTEQISVTAEAAPINTEDASLTETIGTKATSELPLNSRNVLFAGRHHSHRTARPQVSGRESRGWRRIHRSGYAGNSEQPLNGWS